MLRLRKRNQAAISICLSLLIVFSFINTLARAEESSYTGTSASSGVAGTTGGGGTGDGSGTAGTAESGETGDGSGAGGTAEGGASVDTSGAGGTAEGGASGDGSGAGGTAEGSGSGDSSGAGGTAEGGASGDGSGAGGTVEGGASGDGSGAGHTTDGSSNTDTGTNDSAAGTGGSSSDQQDDSLNPAEGTGQEEEVELAAPPVTLGNLPAIALPEPIQVAGSASDSTVTMAKGNIEVDASDNTWEIILSSGTLKSSPGDEISSELSVSGIPSGLSLIAVNGGSNNIIITVSGLAAADISSQVQVAIRISGGAVNESGAADSEVVDAYINPASQPLKVQPMLSLKSPSSLQVAGTPTDMLVVMDTDGRNVYALNNTWTIRLTSGTPNDTISSSDIAITPALPGSLSYSVAKSGTTDIAIILSGTSDTLIDSEKTFTVTVKGSAVSESGYSD